MGGQKGESRGEVGEGGGDAGDGGGCCHAVNGVTAQSPNIVSLLHNNGIIVLLHSPLPFHVKDMQLPVWLS
jgi:hypothetical protein